MPLLPKLSSHACKHYLALLALSKGRQPGEPIPVTLTLLATHTNLHLGVLRTTRDELVKHGIIEVIGRGCVRLLTPGRPWLTTNGNGHPPSSVHGGDYRGGSFSLNSRTPNSKPRGGPGGEQVRERQQALECLAWGSRHLGLATHPGTQYGKICLRALTRRLREGYPVSDCQRVVANAAARRRDGDKFGMLTALHWIWGKGFVSLLTPTPNGAALHAGTSPEQRDAMTQAWAARMSPDNLG